MAKKELLLPVRLTAPVFREFAVYDAMGRQKRWRGALLVGLVLGALSLLCYALTARWGAAWVAGTVLLALALCLPAAYFTNFFLTVKAQGERVGGRNAPIAYTVRLREEGMQAESGKERAVMSWEELHAAVRLQHSVCIYATERQAYLLPGEAGEKDGEEIWAWVREHMPREKWKDRVR